MNQAVIAKIATDAIVFCFAEFDGAEGREILSVLRNFDEVFRFGTSRDFNFALLPHAGDVGLPGFAHAANEGIGSTQQKNVRTQSVAASEHAEVLKNDGLKQRGHQFIGGCAYFLQAVDVGFRKHTAFSGNFMQLDAVVTLIGEFLDRNFELGIYFVDDGAGTSGALVIHRRNLLFATGIIVIFEDDDLGVLPAELDHGIDFRMQLLDRERNRSDFLHELGADLFGDSPAPGTGQKHAGVMAVDAKIGFHALEELERLLGLLGFMALVVLPENLVSCRVDGDRFNRGRADVEPNHEFVFPITSVSLMLVHGVLSAKLSAQKTD